MSTRIEVFPAIPDKRYFSMGEAARLCLVRPSVLRFWEREFPMLKASKRVANRRYYQVDDLLLAREIRRLLYDQGFTIAGARQRLSQTEVKQELKSATLEERPIKAIKKAIRVLDDILLKIKE